MVDFSGLANQTADAKYGSQLAALQRALQGSIDKTNQDVNATNIYGEKGPTAIGGAYDALDATLGRNRTDVNTQLTGIANQIGQGYTDARNAYGVGAPQFNGPEGSADAASAKYSQNALDRMLFNNETLSARATGDMRAWAGQMDSINAQGQNIASNTRADALSRFQTELLDSLSNIRLQGTKDQNEYNAQINDVSVERGNFVASEMARLAAEQWERDLALAQMQQEAELAYAQIAAQDRASAASRAAAGDDDAIQWAELERLKQKDASDAELARLGLAQERDMAGNYTSGERAGVLTAMNEMMAGGASYNQVKGYADSVRGTDPVFGKSLDSLLANYAKSQGQSQARVLRPQVTSAINKLFDHQNSGGGDWGRISDAWTNTLPNTQDALQGKNGRTVSDFFGGTSFQVDSKGNRVPAKPKDYDWYEIWKGW